MILIYCFCLNFIIEMQYMKMYILCQQMIYPVRNTWGIQE